jgi:hypothetical protein
MANEGLPDSVPPETLPREQVRAEIDDAARATAAQPDFPRDYVGRVRDQAAAFALRTAAPDDIRAAIALLEEQTVVDAQAPVESRNRGVETAKKAVRKAVFFTTNHLTEQLRALGWATTSVAEAAAERIEALEARVRELEAQVARLEGDRRPRAS